METTRQAKISRLLQKELSEIFRQQTSKTHGVIVSVSAVRVTPDLSIAVSVPVGIPHRKICRNDREHQQLGKDHTL